MGNETFREWKNKHPEGTIKEWILSRADKRKATVPKRKTKTDNVSMLDANKDRGLVKQ
jgi:hypothetical protein